jgi:hypothetical protein
MVGKFARQVKLLLLREQTPLAQFYSLGNSLFRSKWEHFCRSFEAWS